MAMPRKWPGETQAQRHAAKQRAYRECNVEKVRQQKRSQYLRRREDFLARSRQQTIRRRLERSGVPVEPISIALRGWK
jgi:hypothetical protein